MPDTWGPSLGREGPLEKEMATHSSILVWGNPMDRGALWATVHRVTMRQTRLNTNTFPSYWLYILVSSLNPNLLIHKIGMTMIIIAHTC